jgi:hypothetical protein
MRRSISPHLSGDAVGPEQLAAVAQRVAILNTSWLVIETGSLLHVVPNCDLKEHDVDGACWCAPYEDDGVIVHNSMDQREVY